MIPDKFNGLQGVAGIAGVLLLLRRGRLGGGFANHKTVNVSALRSDLNTPRKGADLHHFFSYQTKFGICKTSSQEDE
ncbi:hypothetical protein DXU84_22140 [Rahnella sp. RcJ3]|nr:hypothetical protein [Rahnella sp. RcJ3]